MRYCETLDKRLKLHENILEHSVLVEKNYKIMQLYSPSISYLHQKQINFSLEEFEPKLENLELIKKDAREATNGPMTGGFEVAIMMSYLFVIGFFFSSLDPAVWSFPIT